MFFFLFFLFSLPSLLFSGSMIRPFLMQISFCILTSRAFAEKRCSFLRLPLLFVQKIFPSAGAVVYNSQSRQAEWTLQKEPFFSFVCSHFKLAENLRSSAEKKAHDLRLLSCYYAHSVAGKPLLNWRGNTKGQQKIKISPDHELGYILNTYMAKRGRVNANKAGENRSKQTLRIFYRRCSSKTQEMFS